MRRRYWSFLIATLLSTVANAQVYNAATDFSATQNPNAQWDYGFFLNYPDSRAFNRYTDNTQSFSGAETWSRGFGTGTAEAPAVLFNRSSSTIAVGTGSLHAGELGLQPGESATGGLFTAVRWTSTSSDYYRIDATFLKRDAGETFINMSMTIPDCGISICSTYSLLFGAGLDTNAVVYNYSNIRFIPAGASINFAVGNGADRSAQGDLTALMATISVVSPVPEPNDMLLLSLGLLGLAAFRRQSQRNA